MVRVRLTGGGRRFGPGGLGGDRISGDHQAGHEFRGSVCEGADAAGAGVVVFGIEDDWCADTGGEEGRGFESSGV